MRLRGPIIRSGTRVEKEKKKEKDRHTRGRANGNDPLRDDRLHNDPPGIVRKLIADKIERSQDGIKRKPLIARSVFDLQSTRKLIRLSWHMCNDNRHVIIVSI